MNAVCLKKFLRAHDKDELQALIKAAIDELNTRNKPIGAWKGGPPPPGTKSRFASLFAPGAPGAPAPAAPAPAAPIVKKKEGEDEENGRITSICIDGLPVEEAPRAKGVTPLYEELRQAIINDMKPIRSSNIYVPRKGGYAIIDFENDKYIARENEAYAARALVLLKKKYPDVGLYYEDHNDAAQ